MAILISPEFEIILDENYKLVGEARKDVAILDLTSLTRKVDEISSLSNELIKSLDPSTAPMLSRPRREGVYRTAGLFNNIVIGFVIGALLFTLGIIVFIAKTNPSLIQTLFGG